MDVFLETPYRSISEALDETSLKNLSKQMSGLTSGLSISGKGDSG